MEEYIDHIFDVENRLTGGRARKKYDKKLACSTPRVLENVFGYLCSCRRVGAFRITEVKSAMHML